MRRNVSDFLLWLACLPIFLCDDLKHDSGIETTKIENVLDSSAELSTEAKDFLKDDTTCKTTEFTCSPGLCIPLHLVCDSKNDCQDGSDEGDHCDVDECAEEGLCSQLCHNAPGGYRCTCMQGYRLENRTCLAEGPEPLLVFSTLGDIKGMYLRTRRYFTIHLAVKKISAVDVDPSDSTAYWIEPSLNGSSVYASKLDGTGFRVVLNKGLPMPEDIAVDYLGNNLYITDSYLKQVMACKKDGSMCYVLHSTEIEKPRAIALDPSEGLMYWSDWGKTAVGIYRSVMDGSRRITMVSQDIKWPNGIAIDHTTNRLYWCDAQLERIEFVSLDGNTRKIVFQYHLSNPYSLAVFEDTLYWSDWATFSLNSCNKFKGHNQTIIARGNGKHIMGVHVYHPVLKKTNITSSCLSNGGCSHLCLLTPEGRSCACPAGMLLSNDSATCEAPPQGCPGIDFQCKNGRCILRSLLCDFSDDCGDNSDESNCPAQTGCAKDQFSCGHGECTQALWRCDGEPDCADGSDETACHNTTCHDQQLRCDHGQCVPAFWACDGADDCLDGTDERNCNLSVPTCKEGQFRCHDDHCIYDYEVCDGHDDCSKAEDELNCTVKTECTSEQFDCPSPRRCIPKLWMCDGEDDCDEAADEVNCTAPHRNQKSIEREECEDFACESGECLPRSKVCDAHPDCVDSSDEGGSCSSSCHHGNAGCSQNCQNTPDGPRCSCLAGFELMPDRKTCEDIDECQVPGNCSQYCTNTKGGFECACAPGYFLEFDHRRCKADGGAATLMYLLPDQIRGIDLVSRALRIYVSGERTDMRGMDCDASDGTLFWTEWKESRIYFLTPDTNRSEVLLRTLKRPYCLKWDWVGKNIYYTDSEGSIRVCRRDGKFCTVVLDRPASHINSLELDPLSGLMFWSVWSVELKKSFGFIERAEMDGSQRTVIVSDKIYWPTGINVDRVLKYIYWADAKLNNIQYADFNGLNRKEIVQDTPYYPFSMALFEDKVFWANWGTDTIMHCNRFTGESCVSFHKGDVKAETMMVVHKVQQPKEENRCENTGCYHICLLTRSGYRCRCAEGYKGSDGSCEINTTTPLPTTQQSQCPEGYCMRGMPCEMIGSYKLCQCREPFDGARCEKYMVGMEPALDYSLIVGLIFGLGMIVAIIVVGYLLCRKYRLWTQTPLTVNSSTALHTIQGFQLSPQPTKLEGIQPYATTIQL